MNPATSCGRALAYSRRRERRSRPRPARAPAVCAIARRLRADVLTRAHGVEVVASENLRWVQVGYVREGALGIRVSMHAPTKSAAALEFHDVSCRLVDGRASLVGVS